VLGAKAAGWNVLLPGTGGKPWRKRGKVRHPRGIPGASRRNEREDGHGRAKEDEGREQEEEEEEEEKEEEAEEEEEEEERKKKKKAMMMTIMEMMMMMMVVTMTRTTMMTMTTEDRDDDDVNKVSAGLPERRDETREDEARLD